MKLGTVLCLVLAAGMPAIAQTPTIERHVIVQGSVGQPGREHAFLTIENPDQVEIDVVVTFVREGNAPPIMRHYQAKAEERKSVNVALDVPELLPRAYFSVVATVEAADGQPSAAAIGVTWHRASDFQEVESRTALIRRSPKR